VADENDPNGPEDPPVQRPPGEGEPTDVSKDTPDQHVEHAAPEDHLFNEAAEPPSEAPRDEPPRPETPPPTVFEAEPPADEPSASADESV